MKNEKKPCRNSTGSFLLWISFFLAFAVSCQDGIIMDSAPEVEDQSVLNANEIEPGKYTGDYEGGKWKISLPGSQVWNNLPHRYMVFYAHGMVDPVPYESIQLPSDFIGGKPIEDIITEGFMGYASTSYRDNGLIVLDAVKDIKKLVDVVNQFFRDHPEYMAPDFLFLGGPSEGGLVTVKTIEKYPQLFDGAICICGPIGDFYEQLQYNGDFHVLFNYFFGRELSALGINLGNPKDGVHPDIMRAWKFGNLQQIIIGVMSNFPERVPQLLRTANVTVDMTNPVAMGTAILELLRFNIMLTDDVTNRMMGVPYSNFGKVYSGSDNDPLLNESVQRIRESSLPRVKNMIRQYETSGKLIAVPLVTIHTTGDHVIPFWHETEYPSKIFPVKNDVLHTSIPVENYGHCTINEFHIRAALLILINKTTSISRFQIAGSKFQSSRQLTDFKEILNKNSIELEVN